MKIVINLVDNKENILGSKYYSLNDDNELQGNEDYLWEIVNELVEMYKSSL